MKSIIGNFITKAPSYFNTDEIQRLGGSGSGPLGPLWDS